MRLKPTGQKILTEKYINVFFLTREIWSICVCMCVCVCGCVCEICICNTYENYENIYNLENFMNMSYYFAKRYSDLVAVSNTLDYWSEILPVEYDVYKCIFRCICIYICNMCSM